MKVICRKNTSKDFDFKEVTGILSNDVKYSLEIGKEYLVMGLMIRKESNCLYYLTDDNGFIDWNPYCLFDISDNTLPDNWYVNLYDKKSGDGDIYYLCGFYELCNDEDFHDSLMDRDENTMRIYFRRKMEYENSQNSI